MYRFGDLLHKGKMGSFFHLVAAIMSDLEVDQDEIEERSSLYDTSDDELLEEVDTAPGAVEDADWETARGDFTKQYNRARQMASALQTSSKDTSSALPAVNRARLRQKAAPVPGESISTASEEIAAHPSKSAAQIAALSKFAARIHIEDAYDPSRVAGGSVDGTVPRKTNKLEINRRKDKADRATLQQVLDPRTLLILSKMIRREIISEVNGCISTGKEASVYYAVRPPASPEQGPGSAAIKIYKTSILVFKDRDRYVSGEFRFRHGYSRHNPRKMVRLWAEKEMRNLKRLVNAGIRAPPPIELRDHVLVMEFLGDKDGWSSPRLKDAESLISPEDWPRLYCELLSTMRLMYHRCRLVHADLSEYNILFHEGHLWIIDVSQSVEHDHLHAFDFLREDIAHVDAYFSKHGVETLGLRQTFHFVVKEAARSRGGGVAGLEKLEHGDEQIDAAVLDIKKKHVQANETEESLMKELSRLLDDTRQTATTTDAESSRAGLSIVGSLVNQMDEEQKNETEESVFRQSYLPRKLDEIYDPERDAAMVRSGQVSSLIYSSVTGLNDLYDTEADPDQATPDYEAGEPDTEDATEDDSDSSEELDPEQRQNQEREERKNHKKQVKEANRERRKTKMPKAEKKRRMKKTTRKK